MDKLLQAINDFYEREYDGAELTIESDGLIFIGSTEYYVYGTSYEISVAVDTVRCDWVDFVNGEEVNRSHRESFDEIADELNDCDFMSVLYDAYDVAYDKYGAED